MSALNAKGYVLILFTSSKKISSSSIKSPQKKSSPIESFPSLFIGQSLMFLDSEVERSSESGRVGEGERFGESGRVREGERLGESGSW